MSGPKHARVRPAPVVEVRTQAHLAERLARQLAGLETQVGGLEAAIAATDPAWFDTWSGKAGALDEARKAAQAIRQAMEGEGLAELPARIEAADRALREAVEEAAGHEAANRAREHNGAVIMQALQDMGYDVSFEPGSRLEPLRISGQTPDVSGRGDFDIAIPLDGDVNFEVVAEQGDEACVQAILQLQDRLKKRGIGWTTSSWGHAKKPETTVGGKTGKDQLQEGEREKERER